MIKSNHNLVFLLTLFRGQVIPAHLYEISTDSMTFFSLLDNRQSCGHLKKKTQPQFSNGDIQAKILIKSIIFISCPVQARGRTLPDLEERDIISLCPLPLFTLFLLSGQSPEEFGG